MTKLTLEQRDKLWREWVNSPHGHLIKIFDWWIKQICALEPTLSTIKTSNVRYGVAEVKEPVDVVGQFSGKPAEFYIDGKWQTYEEYRKSEPKQEQEQWEYTIASKNDDLSEYGAKGWRLKCLDDVDDYIMERKIK